MENTADSEVELKKKLVGLLQEDSLNHDSILSLSHEIASLKKNKVRFSIDAGVIDRLGQELVARQETAVSELVKNSFDADSELVTLTFEHSDSTGGTLIIDDDGDGMTREELVDGFMRISSTSKFHNPLSRKYKRHRAGQKGIGRFSVQRLGLGLHIITQVDNSDFALSLKIDWSSYEKDLNLLAISNDLDVVEKVKEKGTRLIITGLRDKWSTAAIRRVYRYVSNIIQPFSLAEVMATETEEHNEEIIDPGFKASFYKQEGDNKPTIVADQEVMVYDHAVAEIEGHIDESGIGILSVESKKLKIHEIHEIGNDPDDPSVPFALLRNIHFKAFYYIYDSDLLPKMHSTSIRQLAQREGGIKLYRNGFRVLPYAEPGDDWLDLDRSARRRSLLPQHTNLNFFGFVEMKDPDNAFNETSSREGLIENEAFRQLKNFVHRTILTGVMKVAAVRNIKQTPSQKKDDSGNYEEITVRIKNIAKTIDELEQEFEEEGEGNKKRSKRKTKAIKDAVEELDALHKSELKRTIKERSMLRVLSSIGLTVAQFIHEIKHYLENINGDISALMEILKNDSEALERLTILESNFKHFNDYTSYYDSVISANVINDLVPLSMHAVAKQFLKAMEGDAKKAGIELFEPSFSSNWLFTKPMHPSEWSSILFNLYTNSKKAIKRQQCDGEILIECGEEDGLIFLEFSDNGDGIPEGEESKIFDEFYTTTSTDSLSNLNESTEKLGTGLGLKIVKDIVKGYRGSIKVVSQKGNFSTCIRVEVGKVLEKDIEKYGL